VESELKFYNEIEKLQQDFDKLTLNLKEHKTKRMFTDLYKLKVDLDKCTKDELTLIHVKLHNLAYSKKYKNKYQKLKELHDKVALKLGIHLNNDKLDEKNQKI